MPRIIEYRIPFPCTCEEYKLGQIYMVAKLCSEMTDPKDGAGVESIKNEPCTLPKYGEGMYTKKFYHFRSRLPGYVRAVTPKSATFMQEEAWNCFPYAKTVINHPSFTKFGIEIITLHAPAKRASDGKIIFEENIHKLGDKELKKRKVKDIDIGDNSDVPKDKYDKATDPAEFRSEKANKGPLKAGWQQKEETVMVAYKLVTISCGYFGITDLVEGYLENYEYGLFKNSHRSFFCWMDSWWGLTSVEIRAFEERVNKEMTERMQTAKNAGPVGEKAIGDAIKLGGLDQMGTSSSSLPSPDPSS